MMFDYARNLSLNSFLNGQGEYFTNVYQIALLVVQADPADTTTTLAAKEPSGNGYARITTSAGMWTTTVSGHTNAQPCGHGTAQNKATLAFPQSSGLWGTCIQTALLSQVSGSTYQPLFYGPLRPEIVVSGGQPVTFGVGSYHMEIRGFGFADSTRDQIMLGYFGGSSYFPSQYYLALLNNLPEPDSTGFDECVLPGTNAYSRVSVAQGDFTSPVTGIAYNSVPFSFAQPTGTWGTAPIVAWSLMDAASGGTMWFCGELNPAIAPITASGLPPVIAAGQMQVSLDALR